MQPDSVLIALTCSWIVKDL